MNDIDTWEAFGSKYLKAEDVASNKDKYVITNVESKKEQDKNTVILTVERNGFSKLFGCNATNEQAVKAACPNSPKDVIGKVIIFNKVRTTNPQTHKEVDGLRLQFLNVEPTEVNTDDVGVADDSTI